MTKFELYGTANCPYTEELREDLIWRRQEFSEFDVEDDKEARSRWLSFTEGNPVVPILVENGVLKSLGWQGCTCTIHKT